MYITHVRTHLSEKDGNVVLQSMKNYLQGSRQWILLFLALNAIIIIVGVQGFSHGKLNNFHD